ncbi:MAG TPA: hypothetical protein VH518_06870 [Tepidisphaeraceae bacterium]|jgi:hypothetical protein
MQRLGMGLLERIRFTLLLLLFFAPVVAAAWRQKVQAELNAPMRTEPTFPLTAYLEHADAEANGAPESDAQDPTQPIADISKD